MDIEQIEELIEVLHHSSLTRMEVETDAWQLQVERPPVPRPATPAVIPAPAPSAEPAPPVSLFDEPVVAPDLTYVEAPIVGVFHEANHPIAVGQSVRAGEVLGSIEALALRNDVRSPIDGEVTAVQVEDGQPVEYGQVLFTLGRFGEAQ